MMFRKVFTAACLSLGLGAFSPMASAALIATIPGNDCAGEFGQNFADCAIPAQFDPNQTPIIIKFDFNEDGIITTVEINSALFPSIDGDEFDFTFTGTGTGSWLYTPGAGDPGINFFVAKGGPNFNLFDNPGDPNSDDFFAPTNPNTGTPFGLSHLSFYDTTNGGKVPEPTTMLLLGAALFAARFVRRGVKRA
jgi:PEP-CTERM motif